MTDLEKLNAALDAYYARDAAYYAAREAAYYAALAAQEKETPHDERSTWRNAS